MLSNLYNQTFTIINQIPESQTKHKKVAWTKHILKRCDKVGGIYDKSQNAMVLTSGEYTVYIKDWQDYVMASWNGCGFYGNEEKRQNHFTLAKGDLIIFDEILDSVPTSGDEYDALIEKYADNSMTVADFEVFINYRADGTPWDINHIEVMKK